MAKAIEFLLHSSNAWDVFFVTGPEKTRIGVVKDLVVKCSDVLQKMLIESEIKEKGDVVMPDIYPDAINIFLKYAYGASDSMFLHKELEAWNPQTALHVVDFAEKYNVPELKDIALEHLRPKDVESLFPALYCVVMYNATSFSADVLKILQIKTLEIIQHPTFLDLNENCLVYILQQDMLNVSEVELWKATVAWAKHQVGSDDVQRLRAVLLKPLQHIRLLTVTNQEFWEDVEPTNIFSMKEINSISKSLNINNAVVSTTTLINTNRKKRLPYTGTPITACLDLKHHTHKMTYHGKILSCYLLKLSAKNIKLMSLVCYGCGSFLGNQTVTVTLDPKEANPLGLPSPQCIHTFNNPTPDELVIPLKPFGNDGIELSAGHEYYLVLEFNFNHPSLSLDNTNGWSHCNGHAFEHGYLHCVSLYYNTSRKCKEILSRRNISQEICSRNNQIHSHIKQIHYTY